MTDHDIIRVLSKKGDVKVYSKKYKAFTTGKSENDANEERLFVCTVFSDKKNERKGYVKSPLNYTGGKTRLLPQLLPLFPDHIHTFYDLFCGGANVGINVKADYVVYSDSNADLIGLFHTISKYSSDALLKNIYAVIDKYGLSRSDENGYAMYGCNSADGLGSYNKEKYVQLRNDFNSLSDRNDEYYFMLYVLIVFSFNNQIRFNKKHEFNLPVGKRDFNKNIRNHFVRFAEELAAQKCMFQCRDFRNLTLSELGPNDFVYCDPPYLITTASYNEQNGWTEKDEKDLLELLDRLNARGIRFALSNVMVHKGRSNALLMEWAKQYHIHNLSFHYNNSNYHGKNTEQETKEVLVTNYDAFR
ncbi:MAG: DNA adenine methylase [Anaerovoracaceae bacterium]